MRPGLVVSLLQGLVLLCPLPQPAHPLRIGRCPELPLRFGKVRYRSRGRIATLSCNPSYTLYGEKYTACFRNQWDLAILPKCVKGGCVGVSRIEDGIVKRPLASSTAVLSFSCRPGYDLRGPKEIYCNGYKYDNAAPVCVSKTYNLDCDFESEEGTCSWTRGAGSLNWTRNSGRTPTGTHGPTGPSQDHTLGPASTDGYYVYMEVSGSREGDIATLVSPSLPPATKNFTCLRLWYHMYGLNIGTLRVLFDSEEVFTKSRNQGDVWRLAKIRLPMYKHFKITIEGKSGGDMLGDIAIDDISVGDCFDEYSSSCLNRCPDELKEEDSIGFWNCSCSVNCIDEPSGCCEDFTDHCHQGISTEPTVVETVSVTDGTTDLGLGMTETWATVTDLTTDSELSDTSDQTTEPSSSTTQTDTIQQTTGSIPDLLTATQYSSNEFTNDNYESIDTSLETKVEPDIFTDSITEQNEDFFSYQYHDSYTTNENDFVTVNSENTLDQSSLATETAIEEKVDDSDTEQQFSSTSPFVSMITHISSKDELTKQPSTQVTLDLGTTVREWNATETGNFTTTLRYWMRPRSKKTTVLQVSTVTSPPTDVQTDPDKKISQDDTFSPTPRVRIKWKSKYIPKGRVMYAASVEEEGGWGPVAAGAGVMMVAAAGAALVLMMLRRRRMARAPLDGADILFIPAGENLDFTVPLSLTPSVYSDTTAKA